MMKYAIVQPTLAGFGKIVALCDTQPVAEKPLLVVQLKGYYRNTLGDECPYRMNLGGYEEAYVNTSGT